MDKNYCLIQSNINNIILHYFSVISSVKTQIYPTCFIAKTTNSIYKLISLHCCFDTCSPSHLLYLGKELYKLELSSYLKQKYIQS